LPKRPQLTLYATQLDATRWLSRVYVMSTGRFVRGSSSLRDRAQTRERLVSPRHA